MTTIITKAPAGKQDLSLWDGSATKTFTRENSEGYDLTLDKVDWPGVDILHIYGGGVLRTDTAIQAAVTALAAVRAPFWLSPGTWTIANNLTLGALNIPVLPAGALFSVDSGKTLAFTSPYIQAGGYQIFSGSGAITFAAGSVLRLSWFATMAAAVAYIASAHVKLLVDRSETISADLTIPSNVSVKAAHGCVLTVATTKTLTINGDFSCGLHRSFSLVGTGALSFGKAKRVFPEWTGAEGDGSTDDTDAINQIAASISEGVVVLSNFYKIMSNLVFPANVSVKGFGREVSKIDASEATASSPGLISSQGTLSSSLGGGLNTAVTAGNRTITLNNSSHGLVAGDLIVLYNPADSSWNPDRTYYQQGEFFVVKSTSAAVITLTTAAIDSYVNTCLVYKVTPTNTSISNLKIIGNTSGTSNYSTIYIRFGRGNHFEDIFSFNPTSTAMELNTVFAPTFEKIEIGKWLDDSGGIQASGIIFAGVQYGKVRDSILYGARHGMSMGGGGYLVDRFCVVENSYIASKHAAAADFHGNAEFCEYRANYIDGCINLSGVGNRLIGNDVYPGPSLVTLINMEAVLGMDAVIEDNRFHLRGAGYVLDANDTTDINASTTRDGTLIFRKNKIIDSYAGNAAYLYIRNNGSTAQLRLLINDNHFLKTSTAYYGDVLAVSVVSGSNFNKVVYDGNDHDNTGFGAVAGVSSLRLGGSIGIGPIGSTSPSFGDAKFEPSSFTFEKTINLATAANIFTVLTVPTLNQFLPKMIAGRCDTDITASNGNYLGVGVNAANRRVDFGIFATAAASLKHDKNKPMRFINSSELANQIVDAAETLSLMSVDGATDAAALASNIGGSGQSVTLRVAGMMVGTLPDAS